jgi:hypothetical protein
MATKIKTNSKSKTTMTHKQIREELERAIVLMVLSLPNVELQIVSNYLDRNGYVVQGEAESDRDLNQRYGIPLPSKKSLGLRAECKVEAEKLHKLALATRKANHV